MINHLRMYSGNEDFYFVGTHEMLEGFLDKQNLYTDEEEYIAMGYDFLTEGSLVGLLPINLVIDNSEISNVFRKLYSSTETKIWKVEKVKE